MYVYTFKKYMCECMLSRFSRIQVCATQWTIARQAPLSMGFSRQAYWSGLPCPPPQDLPNPGIESTSLMSPALAGRLFIYYRDSCIMFYINTPHISVKPVLPLCHFMVTLQQIWSFAILPTTPCFLLPVANHTVLKLEVSHPRRY